MTDRTVEVWIGSTMEEEPRLAYATADLHLEAPNWSADGNSLYLNGGGRLWRLDLGTTTLHEVSFSGLPPINNDHVLDPARGLIYLSANDGHIYRAPIASGAAVCTKRANAASGTCCEPVTVLGLELVLVLVEPCVSVLTVAVVPVEVELPVT